MTLRPATRSCIEIVDLDDELVVNSEWRSSIPEAVVSAVVAGGCTALVLLQYVEADTIFAGLASVAAAAVAFMTARRQQSGQLRVTRNRFEARGRIGDRLGSSRAVSSSEVKWLEYQEDTTGVDNADHPGGLYAVLRWRNICLLPYADANQTYSVIERIQDKFPDLRQQWAKVSAFGQNFQTLGLADREADSPEGISRLDRE